MDNGAISYRRYLEGDENGLVEIVELYGASLMLFIHRYVHNLDIAEDLMEDTFCELIFHKNRYRGKSSFKTYLFSIARNKAVDYIRKESRFHQIPLEQMEYTASDLEELEKRVLQEQDKKDLYHALEQLQDEYRTVLYLLYFVEMSYEEISHVMKKNNRQIKNLAYRARQSLKRIMKEEGFSYEG